jgi:hypothetical protein
MSFNSRRASEFKHCDYLKPTLSSMSRAKSVVPQTKKVSNKRAMLLVSALGTNQMDENASFDMSTQGY